MFIDARIKVHFQSGAAERTPLSERGDRALIVSAGAGEATADSRAGWAAVIQEPLPAEVGIGMTGHMPGCSCCTARPPEALALTRLFQARARGEVGFFRGVIADLPAEAAVSLRAALVSDAYLSGCFVAEA